MCDNHLNNCWLSILDPLEPQPELQISDDLSQSVHKWPADDKSRRKRLEAVLFMSRTPVPSRKLSQLAELEDGTQARTMIKELNQHYDEIGRAFHVKQVAGGFQLRTRPQFSDWIGRLEHAPRAARLSGPALETLTVIAYRQPIIKAEIEAVRGVSCGEMLRQLLDKSLVKIAGRSEKLGRPFLYATSKEFLAHFGLNSLADLPRAKHLSGQGLPQWATSDQNHDFSTPVLEDIQTLYPQVPDSEINDSQTKEEE